MGLTLYLLRHGETFYSQTGGYCGALDVDLTPEGLEMAEAFASSYETLSWSAIYASPMKRTITTANPLCQRIGLEPILRDGLKEIRYGEWEGKSSEEVRQTHPDDYEHWLTEPAWNRPTGGETGIEVASRAAQVIAEIEAAYAEDNVLVVSHKATIRLILCNLLGIDLGRYRDRLDVPACALSVVQFGKYGPMLKQLGDRSHLAPHLRNRVGS
jgi:broad specificity phosphatase PhoE